jgi:dTDP-glucose 4,6-dehydratase/UDP-glucuronate decarboxylase
VVGDDLEQLLSRLGDVLPELSGRRLLITGGAGFLGHYLVQVPLAWNRAHPDADPIHVTVHDRFVRGLPAWLAALDAPELEVVERDVLDALPVDGPGFDHLIHAASVASPSFYRQHPLATMDANVLGTRRLLDYAAARAETADPVRRMLFFSTSEIYGDPIPEAIPTPETYRGNVSSTGPRACYDEAKRYGETLCVTFASRHDVPVSIVRPFNNYGPGLPIDDRRVIPDFASDILADRDITLLSDGSATRTFCYVADAVDGYFRVLLRGRPGEPYNVGVETPEITVHELAERFTAVGRSVTGYRGSVGLATSDDPDYLVDNPVRRCPVITKAREELGYAPEVSLENGLERTLRWYVEQR